MDSDTLKFVASFLAKRAAAWSAGALVTIGALQSSQETSYITMASGIILGLMGAAWSWWNDRGKQLVLATLAKAHRIAPESASTATASKALVESVNDNKVLPVGGGAVKIISMLALAFIVLHVMPAMAQPKAATAKPTAMQAQANPILVVQQFTVADLQAALNDANAQVPPDTVAAGCYQALLTIVQAGVGNPLPSGLGLFQAAQKARDAKALIANLQSPTGPLSSVNTACAPLVVDAQMTLVQLGILTGAVAAKVGLTLPIGLPAIP